MRVYHTTVRMAAEAILRDGFIDGVGNAMNVYFGPGVWVAADFPFPFDNNNRDTVLALEIPEALFLDHELIEEDKPYREALIPAALLNQYRPPKVLPPHEVEELEVQHIQHILYLARLLPTDTDEQEA